MNRTFAYRFSRTFLLNKLSLLLVSALVSSVLSIASARATCVLPTNDDGTGKCIFTYTKIHACDDGSISGVVSGVSAGNASASTPSMFQVLANKKLACCLNTETAGGTITTTPKFDCVDNSSAPSNDFNLLWSSTDDVALEGGQLNAMILVSGKQPVTGFYSLNGARCSDFSEFGGTLQPSIVDPLIRSSQQNSVGTAPKAIGTPIPQPVGAGYTDLQTKIKKGVPNSQADMFRCPILVRAAMVVTCPPVTDYASSGKLYLNSVADTTTPTKIYCPLASSISVKIRMEQIYQITGQPTLPPFETTQAGGLSTNISVANIIQQKYGN